MISLLLKSFHDGIIISDNDSIIYENKEMLKILKLEKIIDEAENANNKNDNECS